MFWFCTIKSGRAGGYICCIIIVKMQHTMSSVGANAALRTMLSLPFPRVLSKTCPIAAYGFIFRRHIGTIRIGDGCPMTTALADKNFTHRSFEMLLPGSLRVGGICGDASAVWLLVAKPGSLDIRRFQILPPVQMGRRSSKIAIRKGVQDQKKAKLYGKLGKQIVTVVKEGGPNPASNAALGVLLQQAKDADIPKDIIERNIKKATDKGQQDFVELTYEVYGHGGVGLVLEVLTDNFNRAAATVRDVVKKGGAKMADSGSVLFNFKRAGVVYVNTNKVEGDDLLLAAMDAGAEDVVEPSTPDEGDDYEVEEKFFKVITPVEQFASVHARLKEAGIAIETESSGLELIPVSIIEAEGEVEDLNKALIDKLLELDDVDAVYSNQK